MKRRQKAEFAHRNLPLLLLQAREQLMGRFRPILNEHGVTEQQWRIIRALLDAPTLEPREIGEICRISSPSLAGMLARMDELGLVVRKRTAHDQRRVQVRLTAKSRTLAARIAPRVEETYRQMELQLGNELLSRLYRMLDEILASPVETPQRIAGDASFAQPEEPQGSPL
ncbi:MAG: homoprotocatechuate degradation operon regulator HpaR [Pseudomonadota bacterium]|nr:homoprotocatechuate degradation operon regulator HpaR [Pseudomonadota bacterium]